MHFAYDDLPGHGTAVLGGLYAPVPAPEPR